MKRIASRENPEFRRLLRLARSGRERRASGTLLLDGEHLIEAYGAAFGYRQMQVVLSATHADDLAQWAVRTGREPVVLSDGLFRDLSPVDTPTGVLAVAPISQPPPIGLPEDGFTVLVDGVQDPGNLGAILRSAAAAGGRRALLSAACADPWAPRCLRGGMGAQFLLDIEDRVDLAAAAGALPGPLVAADVNGDRSLFEANLRSVAAFVVGAEGKGVSGELLELSRLRVRIPMRAGVESLNTAVAATLLFYEWRRQREGGPAG